MIQKYRLTILLVPTIAGALFVIAVQLAFGASSAHRAQPSNELTVCPSGPPECQYTSLQAAVNAAQSGDVVKVAAGTYTGVQSLPAPPGYLNPPPSGLVTQVVFISRNITLRGGYTTTDWSRAYPLSYPTTLDAQRHGRVLFIAGDISPTIEGLHITGGDAAALGGGPIAEYDTGGGVSVLSASATLSHNWIYSNVAAFGGGVFLRNSDATVVNTVIAENLADQHTDGGGVFIANNAPLLRENRIIANTAGLNGGGVMALESDAMLAGNIISGNTATFGGGVFLWFGDDTTLDGNVIADNTAESFGGGVQLWYNNGQLVNNIIYRNHADKNAGGLYINISSPRLMHNTIVSNTAADGTGVYVRSGTPSLPSSPVFSNNIIVSHTVGITVAARNTATLEATLWGNQQDWGGDGAIQIGQTNVWGDPAFVNPEKDDYHVRFTSAAIDRGVAVNVSTDFDGDVRPMDSGFDIGADETRAPRIFLPVTTRAYAPPQPPETGEFTPSKDNGTIGEPVTFVTTFHDPNGWDDIAEASLLVNVWQKTNQGLLAQYETTSNTLKLIDDDGLFWVGDCQPGESETLSNSYVSIDCAATTVIGSGNTLTVTWHVTPLAPFSGQYGNYMVFLMALDNADFRDGWNFVALWTFK